MMKTNRGIRSILAAWLLALPWLAHSAVPLSDMSGLWYDPAHPGWGLSLNQQNDTLFAALFIYDANGAPTWYVASSLQASSMKIDACGTTGFTGPLYRTQWPGFAPAYHPEGSAQLREAGTLWVFLVGTNPPCSSIGISGLPIQYTLDGVTKGGSLVRQTWSSNRAQLTGSFAGALDFGVPAALCQDLNQFPQLPAGSTRMQVTGDLDPQVPGGVRLSWITSSPVTARPGSACEIRGAYWQDGQFGIITGELTCGPLDNATKLVPTTVVGSIWVSDLYIGTAGFVGRLGLRTNTCLYTGSISGARN